MKSFNRKLNIIRREGRNYIKLHQKLKKRLINRKVYKAGIELRMWPFIFEKK